MAEAKKIWELDLDILHAAIEGLVIGEPYVDIRNPISGEDVRVRIHGPLAIDDDAVWAVQNVLHHEDHERQPLAWYEQTARAVLEALDRYLSGNA